MSAYTAIADVGETLLDLMRQGMVDVVGGDHVILASPADIELDTDPWLALFAYRIEENTELKNEPPVRASPKEMRVPASVVNADFLLVPYAQSRETEYQIMGKALQVLAARTILRGSVLRGALAGTDAALEVVHQTLALEELLRLWNTFNNRPYKLSVSYQVRAIRIDSTRAPIPVQPVVERVLTAEARR